MSSIVKRISTGTNVLAVLPASEDPVEYPEDYFKENPGKVKVFISRGTDLNKLRQFVYEGIKSGDVSVCHINSYLYQVLKGIQEEAPSEWKSFGVQIAVKGQKIGIFDLLEVDDYRGPIPDGKSSSGRTADDDKWLPMLILGLYRVGRATQEDYKKMLMSNLNAQCKLRSNQAEEIVDDTSDFYQAWGNDSNFLKIVAAVDMFFHYFKKNPEANIRFGTIVSRFKDCAALTTLAHLQKVTGLPIEEVFSWILTRSVEDEVCRMMKPGQEIDQANSFMPYLIDLGLSTKSPYSSVKNPSFHFWGQLTALLVQSSRAKNARVPDDIPYAELTKAAQLFGFAIGHSSDLEQRFALGDKVYKRDEAEASGSLLEPPTSKDVIEWLAWWDDVGNIPTPEMDAFAKRAVHGMIDVRTKTIGEYARKIFS
ncbi:nucleoprotein [Vesiculovirus jurona]|uniref:Nucleoprotein n=1 Tax=Vesiculovirus jurona TaxID=1972568 RepID=I1SV86_9RHAB|nr:nucleoprotein [Vesiculovirus jurona]AEG25350.1 nucleocapsid protein [Vesiculovirus jurona]AJR28385.1 nucleoprotein [Vesiculovirus jurona]